VADRPVPGAGPAGRAAVLGRPVGHSLSPLLHRAAYAALGLAGWTYDALDLGPEDLPVLLAGLGPEWRGFSVTMPCKQAAVAVADEVEPLPRLLGAANTLVPTGGGWRAENTDVHGVGMALQVGGVHRVGHAAIVGAGGTAAAAAVALAELGAESVDVLVREPSRAADVVRVLDVLGVRADVRPIGPGPGRGARRRQHRARRRAPRPRRPALARRADPPRRRLRAVAHPRRRAGGGGGGHGGQRHRGAVLAGHRPGRADDRPARAARCHARRPRRPLTRVLA
jgi:hypothetical protein